MMGRRERERERGDGNDERGGMRMKGEGRRRAFNDADQQKVTSTQEHPNTHSFI
jgi:hypothetical protein